MRTEFHLWVLSQKRPTLVLDDLVRLCNIPNA